MQVLHHEDRGVYDRQALEEPTPRREGLIAIGLHASLGADERRQPGLHPSALTLVLGERHDRALELLGGDGRGVGLEDPGLRLDDLPECPEGDRLTERQAPALSPDHEAFAFVAVRRQLVDHAALADARFADDRDELDRSIVGGSLEHALEQLALRLAPDQRDRMRAGDIGAEPGARGHGAPQLKRFGLALHLGGLEGLEVEHVLGRRVGRFAHRDASDGGGGLQAGGGIHDVAGHEALSLVGPGVQRDDGLAGVDADPDRQGWSALPRVHVLDVLEDPQARADRTFGVVLVRLRSPEHGHHGVTDELLNGAPEGLNPSP
jgi:hypothetical protein